MKIPVASEYNKTSMRKRLKLKKKSCCLCKPQKMRLANRWKPKDEALLKEFEKTAKIREIEE